MTAQIIPHQQRAVVVHGVPTHRRLGDIVPALGLGRKVGGHQALRWLLPEKRGKKASSLVVRMAGPKMRMIGTVGQG